MQHSQDGLFQNLAEMNWPVLTFAPPPPPPPLQNQAHASLVYLVSLLASMEHSFHHTLLLEIRALTDRYPALLGGCGGKDVYRMSNSFSAMARLLGRRLEESATAEHCR